MTTNRPLRVFLCHSSADKPAVRELYQQLRAEPWIEPWLDEEELFPGMDWNMEIEKAIEETDVIIVCLSKGSITKEGYVQKEIRVALDYADYKPEGTLFIIPVRLEECAPPKRLARWQYADYFAGQRERAFQRLLVSLKRRFDSLGLKIEQTSIKEEDTLVRDQDISDWLNGLDNEVGLDINPETLVPLSKMEEKSVEIKNPSSIAKEKSLVQNQDPSDLLIGLDDEAFLDTPPDTLKPLPKKEEKPIEEMKPDVKLQTTAKNILLPDNFILSNGMEFVRISRGEFIMGSDNNYKDEKPQHIVDIPYEYWMARYPTTNELYDVYVKALGIKHSVNEWEDKKKHPVTNVNMQNAIAYCQWLSGVFSVEIPLNMELRLPTEAEWEKAARGVDGRKFPWGNIFDINKCNVSSSELAGFFNTFAGETTPVDMYSPQSDSPFGCGDMVGNTRELVCSLYRPYPYNSKDGRENIGHIDWLDKIVIRSSSFASPSRDAHISYRSPKRTFDYFEIGFRVCLAPFIPK